ncbi:MAG: hypothetical protein IPG91_20885 [Ideonella sp.]|nr:hypothetical protein [Ideonella sp.]
MAADASSLSKLVPGFDFLEGLVKNAGAAIPGMGQWVAPTIDPAELDKRIQELRTVQYWLEQNARMLGATIQALEVQRMTLSTLQNMNVQMTDLRDALLVPAQPAAAAPAPRAADKPAAAEKPAASPAAKAAPAAPAVDPMQWWGALTKQFTELASAAIKNGGAAAEGAVAAAAPAAATAAGGRKQPARKAAAKKASAPAAGRSRGRG